MSKFDKVALYAIKEYTKEQERKRKAAEKEEIRKEKERQKIEEQAERRKEYEVWRQGEESWHKIFGGTLKPKINWEEKLSPRSFQQPDSPKTEHLVGQAICKVKVKCKNRLLVTLISSGVFLWISYSSGETQEIVITGVVGLILALIAVWIWRKRKKDLRLAVESALSEKVNLEKAYLENVESSKVLFEQKENERIAKIEALLRGEEEAVSKTALRFLHQIQSSVDIEFRVEYRQGKMELKIKSPGLIAVQNQVAVWNAHKGTVKYALKPQKEIIRQYERYIGAWVFRSGGEVFRSCPTVEEIYLSVWTEKHHRTKGYAYDACILSCILNYEGFQGINFKHVEYIDALENFQLRFSSREKEIPGDVQPQQLSLQIMPEEKKDILTLNLDSMSGEQFEDFVKILVCKMGLQAEKTKKSHDGGIDIWAYSNHALTGGRYIIQCKRWTPTIPVDVVRDLFGTVTREQADKGILITTSKISSDCYKFIKEAQSRVPITLIPGTELRSLMAQYGLAE